MTRNRSRSAILVAGGLAISTIVPLAGISAQDAHYWTYQYGAHAGLLGGAVIGSVSDVSGTFYNPGGLAKADTLGFALSVSLLEFENVTLEDAAGDGIDLGTTRSGLIPSMVGGAISTTFLGDNTIAYSLITRQRGGGDVTARITLAEDQIPPAAGLTDFLGVVRLESTLSELWGGLTWARNVGSHVGVGLTWYAGTRSQRRQTTLAAEALASGGGGAVELDSKELKYQSAFTLWKGGVFLSYPRVTAGVTLTTPNLRLAGTGTAFLDRLAVVPDQDGDGVPEGDLAATIQTDMPATYRTPLSIGAGFAWRVTVRTRLHLSAEWFDRVKPYDVLPTEDFESQSTGQLVSFSIIDERKAVLNYAAGLEHRFTGAFKGYVAFFADRNGRPDDPTATDLAITNWNVYIVGAGADVVLLGNTLALGIGYGWGSSRSQQLANFLEAAAGDLLGDPASAQFKYRTIRLGIGIEH